MTTSHDIDEETFFKSMGRCVYIALSCL